MRIIYCSLLLLLSTYCFGEKLDRALNDSGNQSSYDLLDYALVWESPKTIGPADAYQKVLSEGAKIRSTNLGYTNSDFWFLFSVTNTSNDILHRLIEIGNPQIDSILIFRIEDRLPRLWTQTGDAFQFDERLITHRNFLFPIILPAHENVTLLMKINKKYSSLVIPMYWWEPSSYFHYDNKKILGYGIYFGFLAVCFIYASLTFFFLRKSIYFWYALWVLITALYMSTSIGFSFQFLYPSSHFNSYFRVIVLVISLFTFVNFSCGFLSSRKYAVSLHKSLFVLSLVALSLIPVGLLLHVIWPIALAPFLGIIYFITVVSLLLIILVTVRSFQFQKKTVLFYYLAFGAIIASSLFIIFSELGLKAIKEPIINPYMIGSAIELLIFSLALTYRIKKLYEERNSLTVRIANQQKEMLSAYVNGIEKERERISLELHDDIGSRLSNLKRFMKESTNENWKLDEQIDAICNDVRNLSHQLAPPTIQLTSLLNLVNDLIEKISRTTTISIEVQHYDFPDKLPEKIQTSLYRIIQEALENTARHAKATEVEIQFFGYDQELVLTYEDNGIGFDLDSRIEGHGIKNIRSRIDSVEGKFEIQSTPSKGTILIVQVPWQNLTIAGENAPLTME